MRKCFQNDAKMRSKINDKSMKFQNLRFLVFFAKSLTLKQFFHMIWGNRNLWQINANSMLEKGMQKTWKMLHDGVKMGAQIDTNQQKTMSDNLCEKEAARKVMAGWLAGRAGPSSRLNHLFSSRYRLFLVSVSFHLRLVTFSEALVWSNLSLFRPTFV